MGALFVCTEGHGGRERARARGGRERGREGRGRETYIDNDKDSDGDKEQIDEIDTRVWNVKPLGKDVNQRILACTTLGSHH